MPAAMVSTPIKCELFSHATICLLVWFMFATSSLQQEQEESVINAENNVLNLHYDHCRAPMAFSWKKLRCECPAPLTRQNNECVCHDCMYQDIQKWYRAGVNSELPTNINEIFEELAEDIKESEKSEGKQKDADLGDEENDDPAGEKSDHADSDLFKIERDEVLLPYQERLEDDEFEDDETSKRRRRKRRRRRRSTEDISSTFDPLIVNLHGRLFLIRPTKEPKPLLPWNNRILNRWYFDDKYHVKDQPTDEGATRRFAGNDRILWRMPHRDIMDELITPEQRIYFPSRSRLSLDPSRKKILKIKGRPMPQTQSFSDSVVAGTMEGSAAVGHDMAQGVVSSFRGTGALALGSGGGSAGSAAFTGLGTSDLVISTKGASAKGQAFIGEMARGGTSTTSLLSGSGDAIAVNSLGGKGSASAAGFSTKYTAGGATAAFGPASASLSATPGKGDTSSSASFSDSLNTAAGVTGEGGTVVETSAVGDANQDINNLNSDKTSLFRSKPIRIEPTEFDFSSFFNSE